MKVTLNSKISIVNIAKFTVPSIIMMVTMSIYTLVDGAFVSNLIGINAFSAVNIVYPLMSFITGIGTMLGTGLTAIVSKKLGEGKIEEARSNMTFVIVFSAITGCILSLLMIIFLPQLIRFLGANDAVYQYCYDYALSFIFFFCANLVLLQLQNLLVADGKSYIGLLLTLTGGILNIILDYVFIAIFHMGISGAAIATGIGILIPCLIGLSYFIFKKSGTLKFAKFKTNWRMLYHVLSNGSSEMVGCLSTCITTLLFNLILMRLVGPSGVASVAILLYLDFILVAVSMGYAIGIAPMISYNYGSKNTKKLKKLVHYSIIFNFITGITMTLMTFILAEPLASIFTKTDGEVYALAVHALRIYAFGYIFKGFNLFSSAMFTAFNNGLVSALLSFFRTLVFLVGSLMILSAAFGLQGVWIASPTAEILSFVMCTIFLLTKGRSYYNQKTSDIKTDVIY